MGTSLTGSAAGSFWHRLGELEGTVLDLLALTGGTTTSNIGSSPQLSTRLTSWYTDFISNGTADSVSMTALQQAVAAVQAAPASLIQSIAAIVPNQLIIAAQADTPLSASSVLAAFQLLQDEMVAASASINQGTPPSVGAQTAASWVTPVGNPTWVWSVVDSAGRDLQYVYPGEVVTATILQDSQNGATAGSEPYSMVGMAQDPVGFLDYNWLTSGKYGSGAAILSGLNLVDPLVNNASTTSTGTVNLLVNGAILVTTTTNIADNWTIATGTAGSTITATPAAGGYITGSGILTMVSDGATLLSITQAFSIPSSTSAGLGGTPYILLTSATNNTQYAVFVPYKLSSASPAAGKLQVDLIDGSGNIINDDQGTANSANVDLTTIADTNWHILSAVFRMPKSLPTSTPYKVRVWQPTGHAVSSGKNVILSCMAMATMVQLYLGGPFFIGFRGSTNVNASGTYADAWQWTISATIGKFQRAVFRYFNPPALAPQTPGLVIPFSNSPTISDTLVA